MSGRSTMRSCRLVANAPSQRILTVTEAAQRFGRPPSFVRGLIADGVLPALRQRGRWYVAERDLGRIVPTEASAIRPPAAFPMEFKVGRVRG
jgi:excisionase family DNA binding protein